ncbi:tetratricopeptide repeat protein [Muricauda oceani]|uniref:Tetratricopeptide repeat protein n=1 Tax=Flagellimonas oceani TaxID=2698672 RepID=A0A6G7J8Q7_9FLAO|nr:tetratricopeptide repeat protein [Allomuricauda oceani]MBW8242948.1 tetratricopeptide repeat protein [Allomuricauda oceani]QII47215.1 tetratricopeptide repeat protein [Allomuricauda oceani]
MLSASIVTAQEDFLAKQYFQDGDYEKALVFYEKLVETNPRRTDYAEGLVACYQQLERYDDAEAFLLQKIEDSYAFPTFYIELGYNFTLKNEAEKANAYYDKAINKIEDNPNYGYSVGYRFQKYALLDYAIQAYTKAMELKPDLNYDFQLARIYGEQGDIAKMYQSYLNLIWEGRTSRSNVLRNIDDFISEDPTNENNVLLRKVLLQNAQKAPDILWNELLSWLFVQQKQYSSAFGQEKAIFKRSEGQSMDRLENLGSIALEDKDWETATEIYEYIVDNTENPRNRLNAELNLIDIALENPTEKVLEDVQKKFDDLVGEYGNQSITLQLQIAYANFLTFKKEEPGPAIAMLKESLELPMGRMTMAYVKLALGDILVFDQRFNEALILFTQVQKSVKNDVLGQDARFKVAQTSFYKGDFDWALTQLKVLRSSTSQLIANDAMQLSLLISDNSLEDSTQTALKKYARADLLAYQNKNTEAIEVLEDILQNHKGEKIEDEALLKQAELLVEQKNYESAEFNYQKIVEFYADGILADDAHFALGELYENILNEPEKAKSNYEKIIYNYQDSYYFPQARKNFRRLRGDAIN